MIEGTIVQGVDPIDTIFNVGKLNKKHQAIFLQSVEALVEKDSELFKEIRKAYLDTQNNYTRSILKMIFGNDFEN